MKKVSATILIFSLLNLITSEASRATCMTPELYSAMQEQWSKIPKAKMKKGAVIAVLTVVAGSSVGAIAMMEKNKGPETEAELQQQAAEDIANGNKSKINPAAMALLALGGSTAGLMYGVPSLRCPSCVAAERRIRAEKETSLLLLEADNNDSSQKEFVELSRAIRSKLHSPLDDTYLLALLREGNENNTFCTVRDDEYALKSTKEIEALVIENIDNIQKGLRKAPEME